MRATVPKALTALVDQLDGLFEVHRAGLRTRGGYRNPAFNPPQAEHQVIGVRAADGARLRVHAYGPEDARPVILIHGWTCSLEYWNPQINAFAGQYRVIAFDLRGHGESEFGTPDQLDCHLLADDLCSVLDAVLRPGQRAVLVGHSLGAMTLQAWAGKYPQRVVDQAAAVLLANTGPHSLVAETTVVPFFNRPLPLLNRMVPLPAWLGRNGLSARIVFPPVAAVRWIFARQIMSPDADPESIEFGMNIVRSCRARIRSEFGLLLAEMDLGDAARQLVVPTTVVAGTADDMTPAVHAEQIACWLRETGSLVQFVLLPTGHLGNLEEIERFDEILDEVLTSVREPAEATG
ncbi:alpha/beta fold hydrolase [Nocardia sp. NBC_01329]|uniref:alpha/beta fold hydrolase n=1 Tax=Nocardia sp. NBC_01329 TaxID=2903594 RepID=UPI002E0F22FC|nr:alpha/beta hydrolase [Nocardia sp. NBC_01329]